MKTRIANLLITTLTLAFLLTACTHLTGRKQPTAPAESAEQTTPLQPGSQTPDAALRSFDGHKIELAEVLADQPTVLIFYRGGWCPYCNRHLMQLKSIEADLIDMGYQIVAISPDHPDNVDATMDKNELTYALLSDSDMEAARAFGIAFKVDEPTIDKYKEYDIDLEKASGRTHHLLPVPAVFVVDKKGEIQFTHANPDYQVRLEPDAIVEAARKALE